MDAAIITLHGNRVGQLARISEDFDFRFDFDPEYLASPERATLGQVFEDRLPNPFETSGLFLAACHDDAQGAAAWFHHTIDRAVESLRSGAEGFGFTEAEVATLDSHIAKILPVVRGQG